jgi:hypothetical protein
MVRYEKKGPFLITRKMGMRPFAYAFNSAVIKTGESKYCDARWLYVSGTCWLAAQSPYDNNVFQSFWAEKISILSNPTVQAT